MQANKPNSQSQTAKLKPTNESGYLYARGFTLRVSLLERCQLSCSYCLPQKAKARGLTLAHYAQLAAQLCSIPITKIRFTGGEPLLKADVCEIVAIFKEHFSSVPLAITTNGLRFAAIAERLRDAGLDAVTFHLDTLQDDRYKKIMGYGTVATVMAAIERAQFLGFKVKLNCVVQKGVNDDELVPLIKVFAAMAVEVRFIELMNTGSAAEFVKAHFLSGHEILAIIKQEWAIKSLARESTDAPAERFLVPALTYAFGLIASDSRPFCSNCNRIRLSADGTIRTCLYEKDGLRLDPAASFAMRQQALHEKLTGKISYHPIIGRKDRRLFSMAETGG